MRKAALALLSALLAASAPAFGEAPADVPPALRLPGDVTPLRVRLDLRVVPAEEGYAGGVEIDVRAAGRLSTVWLHAKELKVLEASVLTGGGASPASIVPGTKDVVGIRPKEPLGPGEATLRISFSGTFRLKETHGLFRQKERDDWYAFTHFEPLGARLAFPCFDEPSMKVPWTLTLTVPKGLVAASNTPIASESDGGDGLRRIRFAETKPLPSYLVAFAVGPFDVVDGGRGGMKGVPLRVLTPRGRGAEAKAAVDVTPPLLAKLEEYFGMPYPYDKLDQVALPHTVGFGAMENPGLVTWNQRGLLVPPSEQQGDRIRRLAGTCAHELAHMWFGDFVTMAWWDDLWLNEGFASWMGPKAVAAWKPEWHAAEQRVSSRSGAMSADALVTARKVRQPIASDDDVENAFDGITYGKGAAALSMYEAWLGPETFRKGVRRYLDRHAWKNATSADFLAALEAESGRPVGASFSTFLDQAGVPLLTAALKCEAGKAPLLAVTQKRFLPAGSRGDAAQLWQIPLCVRAAGSKERACTLVTERSQEVPVGQAAGCPAWVLANDGMTGYYFVAYEGDLAGRLRAEEKALSTPERIGLVAETMALAGAGVTGLGPALALVPKYADDPDRFLTLQAIGLAEGIREPILPEALRTNYARFVSKTFGERAKALGFAPKPGEEDEMRLLRSRLVGFVATEGAETLLADEAGKLSRAWLKDRRAVAPDMAGTVLAVAARKGDRAFFDALLAEAKATKSPGDRQRLIGALASFDDPALHRAALDLILGDAFDVRDAMGLFQGAGGSPAKRERTWAFVTGNYDALTAKLPQDYLANLPMAGGGFCSDEKKAEVESFFSRRAGQYTGGPRRLAQTLERIELCSVRRKLAEPDVAAFLKDY